MKMKSFDQYWRENSWWVEHSEEIRDSLSDCSSVIERNKDVLPPCMGQKVVMHWFMHTLPFAWSDDTDFGGFRTSITIDESSTTSDFVLPTDKEFCKNKNLTDWFVVPFRGATAVRGGYYKKHLTKLETSPNWYELFIIMNDLIWNGGRLIDCAITSINWDSASGIIEFEMSS